MEISRQNYEQYFIDFLDGKLNEEQVGILWSFLEFNPDLKDEFADIEKMYLEPETEIFSGKENLLKSESDLAEEAIIKDFEVYCISSMENDIAEEDENVLQGIIKDDPDKADTYLLYQSARLLPDMNILYPGTAKLKKRSIGLPYRLIIPAAAAMAILILLLPLMNHNRPGLAPSALTNQGTKSMDEVDKQNPQVPAIPPNPVETPEAARKDNTSENASLEGNKKPGKHESPPQRDTITLARIESRSIPRVKRLEEGSGGNNFPYLSLQPAVKPPGTENSAERAGISPRLSLWMLADAGIRGLNSVSEDEYHLDRKKDANGMTRRITFDTPVLGISAPVRKSDKQR